MEVLRARNVNDAFDKGVDFLRKFGVRQDSRAGQVLVAPCPVVTVYEKPQERVLFNYARDANPFFHLMESLWMLAGQRDARWLDQFVSDFSSRFAESDGLQHGAYGYRWRSHFITGRPYFTDYGRLDPVMDQLDTVVNMLRKNPDERRAVLTMWNPSIDLGANKKDLPCNTHVYLRVRRIGEPLPAAVDFVDITEPVLDITVCCRSNDIIWGAYGANAVHFSVLQEYLAGRIGVGIGRYYQISNNYHAYVDVFDKMARDRSNNYYGDPGVVVPSRIVESPENFDEDLQKFFSGVLTGGSWYNRFFPFVAIPMFQAYKLWRAKEYAEALQCVLRMQPVHSDWREAAQSWMARRMAKMKTKETLNVR